MDKTIIFGTGGGANTAFQYLSSSKQHEVVGFTADREMIKEQVFLEKPVIPFDELEKHYSPTEFKLFVLLGFSNLNALRIKKFLEAKEKGFSFTSYVSERASIHPSVKIGQNKTRVFPRTKPGYGFLG